MTVHAASIIPLDVLVVRFGPGEAKRVLRRPLRYGTLSHINQGWQNIFSLDLEELLGSKEKSSNVLKFLDTWAQAIEHSNMSKDEKKAELRALAEIQYELLWAWDWTGDDTNFNQFMG